MQYGITEKYSKRKSRKYRLNNRKHILFNREYSLNNRECTLIIWVKKQGRFMYEKHL